MRTYLVTVVILFHHFPSLKCQDIITYNGANNQTIYDTNNALYLTNYIRHENRSLVGIQPFKILQVREKACHLNCLRYQCKSLNVGTNGACELFDVMSQNIVEKNGFDFWAIQVRSKFSRI